LANFRRENIVYSKWSQACVEAVLSIKDLTDLFHAVSTAASFMLSVSCSSFAFIVTITYGNTHTHI